MSLISLYRLVDRVVGGIGCLALGVTKLLPKRTKQPHRILVIRLWGMGDAVVSLPVLKALKERYPNAQVDVICRRRNKAVFLGQEYINRILEYEWAHYVPLLLKCHHYDLVVDLEQYMNLSALLGWWMGSYRIGFSHGVRSLLYNEIYDYTREQHMLHNYLGIISKVGARYEKNHLLPLAGGPEVSAFVDRFMTASRNGFMSL